MSRLTVLILMAGKAVVKTGAAMYAYGSFTIAVIVFLIVAFVVFMLVKTINKAKAAAEGRREVKTPEAPTGPTQEELLTEIRDLLQK